ncbi:hypothetical protein [Ensifer canadensis]
MRFADESSANVKRLIDAYIGRAGLNAPPAEDDPAEVIAPRLAESTDPLNRIGDERHKRR